MSGSLWSRISLRVTSQACLKRPSVPMGPMAWTMFWVSRKGTTSGTSNAQCPGKASCCVLAPPVEGSVGMSTDCSGMRIWLKVGSSTRRFSCLKWTLMLRVVLLPST
ncbi:hypothetical protein EYF80_011544 [Liparis tanakae]|uniref:Uncharacterized protein n=1 Tax=Liparis tanakae TaxID=230148 RepID=A0A4Z2ILH1_9TELE|nr:hypothetical protein EYF80_011544 [Liparis tanakae]